MLTDSSVAALLVLLQFFIAHFVSDMALWAYDYEGERISLHGQTSSYTRVGKENPVLEIKFCPRFACVLSLRGLIVDGDGLRQIAVNVRLAPPEEVAALPIDRFDGFGTFEDLPSTGKCVSDYWF